MGRLPKFQCGHPRRIRSNLTVAGLEIEVFPPLVDFPGCEGLDFMVVTGVFEWYARVLVGSDASPRGICCWLLEASVVSKRPGVLDI